jgi:hypothetical protein
MSMPSIAAGGARAAGPADVDRSALWLALGAVLALGCINLAADPSRLLTTLGDTDDATRLVQVRGLLAGAPWFDTTLPQIGAPQPLVSHWSRLVDLPLALLIELFALFVGTDRAETATRFVWPLLVLLPLVYVIAEEARRHLAAGPAGRLAAAFAAVVAVTSLSGLVQYLPGRIDHHNCMILGAVAGVILAARGFDEPRAGWIAGGAFDGFQADRPGQGRDQIAVQGEQRSGVPNILQLHSGQIGRGGQAIGQVQVIGVQHPPIHEFGREFDELPDRARAGLDLDMGGQGADSQFWLTHESQPEHRALDQFIAAEVAVNRKAFRRQAIGSVAEGDPGGVGQIRFRERRETWPQRLPDSQQGQRDADQQLRQQGRRRDQPFQQTDQ